MKNYSLSLLIHLQADRITTIQYLSTEGVLILDSFFLLIKHKFFMSKFTQEDLVQYLYKETSEQKIAAIKVALENDWALRDSFEQICLGHKNLEEVNLSPRDEAVNNILQHVTKKQGQLYPH